MAREVKIRVSLQQDASYLTRLARAIELDTKRTNEWKRKAIGKINELTILFLQADSERVGKAG